jgi:DnaJ-class molecular chaperone
MPKCAQCKGAGWITKTGHSKKCVSCAGSGNTTKPSSSVVKQKATAESVAVIASKV